MIFADLCERTRRALGASQNDPLRSLPVIQDAVNEALQCISEERDWPWLQETSQHTVVASDPVVALPSDWVSTNELRIENHSPLQLVSHAELLHSYPSTSDVGRPLVFAEYAGELHLRPIPDGTYTLVHYYQRSESRLSQDNEVPLLPEWAADACVAKAAELVCEQTGDTQRQEVYSRKYRGWIDRLSDRQNRTTATPRIRVRRGSYI
jgi:hypothetical protein